MINGTVHQSQTQLFSGSLSNTRQQAHAFVQRYYCQEEGGNDGCRTCVPCKQIEQHQFYGMLWVSPAKNQYTRAELEVIFEAISFERSTQEPFFCIIESADRLSVSCANSLLKLLEEPPSNFYWILFSEMSHGLLPTIVSRCVIKECGGMAEDSAQDLYRALAQPDKFSIDEYSQMLDRTKLSEHDVRTLLDRLYAYWVDRCCYDMHAREIADIYANFIQQPPMPGSVKVALRTLFMRSRYARVVR